jgi:hypothetical protein
MDLRTTPARACPSTSACSCASSLCIPSPTAPRSSTCHPSAPPPAARRNRGAVWRRRSAPAASAARNSQVTTAGPRENRQALAPAAPSLRLSVGNRCCRTAGCTTRGSARAPAATIAPWRYGKVYLIEVCHDPSLETGLPRSAHRGTPPRPPRKPQSPPAQKHHLQL